MGRIYHVFMMHISRHSVAKKCNSKNKNSNSKKPKLYNVLQKSHNNMENYLNDFIVGLFKNYFPPTSYQKSFCSVKVDFSCGIRISHCKRGRDDEFITILKDPERPYYFSRPRHTYGLETL